MKSVIVKYDLPYCDWEHKIDSWIFSERDRKILKRKLLDGITFEALAEECDMSVRQVQYIVKDVLEEILRHL